MGNESNVMEKGMSIIPGSEKVVIMLLKHAWAYFFPDRRRQKDWLNTLESINNAERCFPRTEESEALCRGLYRYAGVSETQPLWAVRELRRYPGLNGQDLKHPEANAFVQNAWLFEHYDIGHRIALKDKSAARAKLWLLLFPLLVAFLCVVGIFTSMILQPLPPLSLWSVVFFGAYAILFVLMAVAAVRQRIQICRALTFWKKYSLWRLEQRKNPDSRHSIVPAMAAVGGIIAAGVWLMGRKWKI